MATKLHSVWIFGRLPYQRKRDFSNYIANVLLDQKKICSLGSRVIYSEPSVLYSRGKELQLQFQPSLTPWKDE